MKHLDPNSKKRIQDIIWAVIIGFSLLIACAYMLNFYLAMAVGFFFGVVIILYGMGNKTIHNFTNTYKWL